MLGRWLGEGIASLTAVLDPAVVVIGGGVSEAGDLLLDPVRAAFGSQLTGRGHRPVLDIRKARLGNRAGLIGAADLRSSMTVAPPVVVGIDIGGTKVLAVEVDADGRVVRIARRETPGPARRHARWWRTR